MLTKNKFKQSLNEAIVDPENNEWQMLLQQLQINFLEGQAINIILSATTVRGDYNQYAEKLNKAISLLIIAKEHMRATTKTNKGKT